MIVYVKQYGLPHGSRTCQRTLFDAIGISAIVVAMKGTTIATFQGLREMLGGTLQGTEIGDPTELADSSRTLHLVTVQP